MAPTRPGAASFHLRANTDTPATPNRKQAGWAWQRRPPAARLRANSVQTTGANSHATSHPNLKIKSANCACEQRANNTRAAFEQRANCARAAFEQRASSGRELARTTRELRARTADSGELTRELRGAPVSRLLVWRAAAPGFQCLTHIVHFS